MKRIIFSTAVLLLLAASISATAQVKRVSLDSGKAQHIIDKRFVPSLESHIPGIVEGSIYNIILCKNIYSGLDYSTAEKKLNWVISNNSSASLRYKAHLAIMYLSFSNEIAITPKAKWETYDYLFKQISEELLLKLLVTNESIVMK
ncbi:MAG: hypothetical protein WCX28_07310 [Bacteriovoracaceae bacterium]